MGDVTGGAGVTPGAPVTGGAGPAPRALTTGGAGATPGAPGTGGAGATPRALTTGERSDVARAPAPRALVTGAGSGIGLATARALRAQGAGVVLLDADRAAVERAAAELGAHGIVCDVSDEAQVVRAVGGAASLLGGPPRALINAAGVYRVASLLELDGGAWDAVQAVNLRGPFLVGREVARRLIEAGEPGAIVNLSSIAALAASQGEPDAHYGASKAGVLALTRSMAVEWGPHGIRVNAVCPGMIETPMLRITDDPEVAARFVERRVPLRRLGSAEDVAALVTFLVSDAASYITGAAIPIDGGVTAL